MDNRICFHTVSGKTKISFHNLTAARSNRVDIKSGSWLRAVIKAEGARVGEICIVFCDDEYLSKINRKYLNNNDLTDVIAFNYTGNKLVGDVFISVERVKENSKKYKVTFKNEICRVMVHGVLHLLGYNDKTKRERARMKKKEEEYLVLLQKRFT